MKKLFLLAVMPLLLCGCSPNAREPDGLALVRVLGVDGASPVTLTAVCAGAEGKRFSCAGEDFSSARRALPWVGEEELALTGIGWLLTDGRVEPEELLFAVLEDRELDPSATVWLAEEGAAALLEACKDPVGQLELLRARGIRGVSAAEALGALQTEGSVLLPVLGVEDGRLLLKGKERWNGQQSIVRAAAVGGGTGGGTVPWGCPVRRD